MAVALKRENPERTAVQITRILRVQAGWAPSDRPIRRHFVRLELDRELAGRPQALGRFEAGRCNELWTGDALFRTRHNASAVTTAPARSMRSSKVADIGISFVFASTAACPRTTP